MENFSFELYLQLSSKYLANLFLVLKLFSKVWQVQMTLIKSISCHEWVNAPQSVQTNRKYNSNIMHSQDQQKQRFSSQMHE